jgi:hypothetical protein
VADVFPPTKKAAIGSICDASLEVLLRRVRQGRINRPASWSFIKPFFVLESLPQLANRSLHVS